MLGASISTAFHSTQIYDRNRLEYMRVSFYRRTELNDLKMLDIAWRLHLRLMLSSGQVAQFCVCRGVIFQNQKGTFKLPLRLN